ncbi:MAG: CTP synthase, partial [Methanosarcinales archaeon]|nr:CTP synthase [Methanosarcinales archaeon]
MVPQQLENEGAADYLLTKLGLNSKDDNKEWNRMVEKMRSTTGSVEVAVVGKYTDLEDSYLSIRESLKHAGIEVGCKVNASWVDAEDFENEPESISQLAKYDGILVPGGFGVRGTEGKISAVKYARENDKPYLGLCLGMQTAVIEFARNVLGYEDANSSELAATDHPVIDLLPEQEGVINVDMGATMRLGDYFAELTPGSLANKLYGSDAIIERHRHRYEVNPKYIDEMEKAGMKFTGRNENRMEIAEIPEHTFFFSSQFHPEFKSRPNRPSPPFLGFVRAMFEKNN